jgi:hypothetical protein
MAPKTPNYRQDRLQRERAQAAKNAEKAARRAEESAKRKALKDADGTPSESNSEAADYPTRRIGYLSRMQASK